MVFVRIVLLILVPVIAMLVLAFTHVYSLKHYPRSTNDKKSTEDLAGWHHQKTLVDYLQSKPTGDSPHAEPTREESEVERDSS